MGCLQSSGKGKNHYVTRAEARDVLADALRTMSMDLIAIVCGYVGVPIAKRGTSPRLLLGFGSSGDGDGQFRNPCFGVACGPGGQIYVSSGSAVQAFSEDGKFLQHIGKGDWKSATGIAFAHGEAYIADRTARSIAVCRDGSVVRRIGSEHMHRGTEVKNHGGDSDRQFLEPGFLAIDSKQQLLFVTEFAHDRVQVLKLDGTFVRGWGGSGSEEGQFVGPLGIAVSPLGEVAVADSRNCRIQVFDYDGRFLRQFGRQGTATGMFLDQGALGVACDSVGNWLTCSDSYHGVQVFTHDGSFITAFACESLEDAHRTIVGVCVDDDGRIIVGRFDSRVRVFGFAWTDPP